MTKNLQFHFNNEYVEEYIEFISTRDFLSKDTHGENHHIFPKSIFGDNNVTIRLSYIDHFKAHWLLVKLYEKENLKREYMKMAKAFFLFIGTNKHRKVVIREYTENEIDEIAVLVNLAKEENRLSSIGELNPFYGKTHSPEMIQHITDKRNMSRYAWKQKHIDNLNLYFANRNPKNTKKFWYNNPETCVNIRLSELDIETNNIPTGMIPGKHTTEKESFLKSLAIKEFYSSYSGNHWKSGEDHPWYGTKHIYNKLTGERKRIKSTESLPDNFEYTFHMTDEHMKNILDAAADRRGIPCPWVAEITNKNPEKIRKTAEKHRGMKRSEINKSNMKNSRKKFFENGGVTATKGTHRYFNVVTRKFLYISSNDLVVANTNPDLFSGRLFKVKNHLGESMYITEKEELPNGYNYAKNSGK